MKQFNKNTYAIAVISLERTSLAIKKRV